MGFRVSSRVRLSGVAFLMAMATGCGGGGAGSEPAAPPIAPAPPPASQLLDWDVHPAASAVLGQTGFDNVGQGNLRFVEGNVAASADGRLFVAANGDVKAFASYAEGAATSQFAIPIIESRNVSLRGNKMVIVARDQVLIYNTAPTSLDGFDLDPDFISSGISGCAADAMNMPHEALLTPFGHLIVADGGNNRVLIWNPEQLSNGQISEASIVVGQPDKESCLPNNGGGTESLSEFTLSRPRGVWSDGSRLIVADEGNNRVLIWNQIPTEDFQPANHVVGQIDFGSSAPNRDGSPSALTLSAPKSVDVSEGGQMAVADSDNHRILVWDAVPSSNVPANHVLGQRDFIRNVENDSDQAGGPDVPSARTLNGPTGARFHGRNLIVVDSNNNRVLVFPASN
ncbi:hypothetical protein [Ramlibacter sp. Leaf400]|uniref:hypothetical protein n=1 Tax=Ramlibacter sp. Leaf400 TaxID=1736365 RepID=UPI0012E3C32C|nr:hypothetical protein [Ramlibacter sp. Leaf400]